jgi:hypothetical protein
VVNGHSGGNFTRFDFVDVTPDPRLSRLNGAHKRMLGFMKVLGRMLILGRVATADIAANHTHAQMNPHVAALNALLAHVGSRLFYFNLVKVSAKLGHGFLLSRLRKN